MNGIMTHLGQSTIFAGFVALAVLALRKNHAAIRHRLWLAASLKFLVPFSLLVALGSRVQTLIPAPVAKAAVRQIAPALRGPIDYATFMTATGRTQIFSPGSSTIATLFAGTWMLGAAILGWRWFRRWSVLRRALASATRVQLDAPIPVFTAPTKIEPGIFGVFRPVLLLPEGFAACISAQELDAIVAHELCHVRRRDNLTSALHMIVETVFWFHPMVWWIGVKLLEERERACDEAVIRAGNDPEIYATGIVNVCKFYLESPLACASGVSGSRLRQRIEEILMRRNPMNLSWTRKLTLAAVAAAMLAIPLAIGLLHAQVLPPAPKYGYEVVSIKPASPNEQNVRIGPGPQGGMRTVNTSVMALLTFAYDLRDYQFVNVPQ